MSSSALIITSARPRLPGPPYRGSAPQPTLRSSSAGLAGRVFSPQGKAALTSPHPTSCSFHHPSLPVSLAQSIPELPSQPAPHSGTPAGHGRTPAARREGAARLPVLQGEPGQLPIVVQPLELQRPAALSHAREHEAVPLQVHLRPRRLRLEIGGHIICGEQRHRGAGYHFSPACSRSPGARPLGGRPGRRSGEWAKVPCPGRAGTQVSVTSGLICRSSSPRLPPPRSPWAHHLGCHPDAPGLVVSPPLGSPSIRHPLLLVSPSREGGRVGGALLNFSQRENKHHMERGGKGDRS